MCAAVVGAAALMASAGEVSAQPLPASCAFTDNPLVPAVTVIKAVHLTELRTCVNDLRSQRGLSATSWTDPVITPQQTTVRAVYVTELRTALLETYSHVGRSAPDFGAALTPSVSMILASYFTALRDASVALAGCTYQISPSSVTVNSSASTGTVAVSTQAGCGWTAVSQVGWVQVTSGQSGTGNGTVGYSVAANESTDQRTGAIIIGSQSFGIVQTGAGAPVVYSVWGDPPKVEFSADAQVEEGPGDLTHPIRCQGGGFASHPWAPVTGKVSILADDVVKASVAFKGLGNASAIVGYAFRARVNNRLLECRSEVDGASQPDRDFMTLLGSGPAFIRLKTAAFIPDNWIQDPLFSSYIFRGDNRGFVESGTARISQTVEVLNSAVSIGNFQSGPVNHAQQTEEFEKSTSLTESEPILLTQEAIDDWDWGPPKKTRWATADLSEMAHEFSRLGPSENTFSKVRYVSIGKAFNPLAIPISPAIDYRIVITLTFGLNQVQYRIEGCHDGYPAYETYLAGQAVYTRAAVDIDLLWGSCDTPIGPITGVIQ